MAGSNGVITVEVPAEILCDADLRVVLEAAPPGHIT